MRKVTICFLLFVALTVSSQVKTATTLQSVDSVFVELHLKGHESCSNMAMLNYADERFERMHEDLVFDENGCWRGGFIALGELTSIRLLLDGEWYDLLLVPGDSISINYDCATRNIDFLGDNVRWQQELFRFGQFLNKLEPLRSLSPSEYDNQNSFLEACRLHKEKTEARLNNFFEENPDISSEVARYLRGDCAASILSCLTQYVFVLKPKERFTAEYVAFINAVIGEIPSPLSQFDIQDDIRNYYSYYSLPLKVSIFYYNALYEHHRRGRISLSKRDLRAIDTAEYAKSLQYYLNRQGTDSLEIEKQMKPYLKSIQRVEELIDKHNIREWEKTMTEDTVQEYFICRKIKLFNDFFKKMPFDKPGCNFLMAAMSCNFLYGMNRPFSDAAVSYVCECITTPKLQNIFLSHNEYYRSLVAENVDEEQIRNRADELAGVTDADSLASKLLSTYRGKVIYMDIWGTWCAPCKRYMQYVPAIKEALSGKDVVFLYLAYASPEEARRIVVKEYGIYGENSYHYNLPDEQMKLLISKYGIDKYPTYIIFDKEGNMVDGDAPNPGKKEQLLDILNGLLNK